jgi:hypothetical protein
MDSQLLKKRSTNQTGSMQNAEVLTGSAHSPVTSAADERLLRRRTTLLPATGRIVSALFVISIFYAVSCLKPPNQSELVTSIELDAAIITTSKTKKIIPIFYNLFVKDRGSMPKAKAIFDEQRSSMLPEHKLFVVSLGYDVTPSHLQFVPNDETRVKILEQRPQGDESVTLQMLWQYCQVVPDEDAHETLVVYLHSKGSFHPSRLNHALRKALTAGALSKECAELPDSCNVCSFRMSPLPFPHTPGNMWLSRCSYIKKLVSPTTFQVKMEEFYKGRDTCNGRSRWSQEHYIHHHKDVKPCDLLERESYTWSYDRSLNGNFKKDLQPAPRFNISTFLKPKTCDGFGIDVRQRLELSHLIYNDTSFDKDWYGWKFFPNATELANEFIGNNYTGDFVDFKK